MKAHYIYGSGSYGCLYDQVGVADTFEHALLALAATLNLGRSRRARLRHSKSPRGGVSGHQFGQPFVWSLALKPVDRADYCEIVECFCATPWIHSEDSKQEDWQEQEINGNR